MYRVNIGIDDSTLPHTQKLLENTTKCHLKTKFHKDYVHVYTCTMYLHVQYMHTTKQTEKKPTLGIYMYMYYTRRYMYMYV